MEFKILRGFAWMFQRRYSFLFYWILSVQEIILKHPLYDKILMVCLNIFMYKQIYLSIIVKTLSQVIPTLCLFLCGSDRAWAYSFTFHTSFRGLQFTCLVLITCPTQWIYNMWDWKQMLWCEEFLLQGYEKWRKRNTERKKEWCTRGGCVCEEKFFGS